MRICIYGAGATGGHFAVKLAAAGHDVCVIARGPHLAAIRQQGLALRAGDKLLTADVKASDRPDQLGAQDIVIVAVKATALKSIAASIAPLLAKDSLVVFPQNGMTWWYPCGLSSDRPRPPDIPVFRLGDGFLRVMQPGQILGGIIYSANEIESPGIIRNNSPTYNRMDVGPIDGREAGAIDAARRAFAEAGILSPRPRDIREAVWLKLVTNIGSSVIALVTGSNSSATRADPGLSEIFRHVVREGLAISAAHGFPLDDKLDPDAMLARLVDHKPSLLQDYEQRRPMEIGEMVLAPLAFARAKTIAVPTLDVLAAIAARLAIDRGLFPPSELEGMGFWKASFQGAGKRE